MDTQEPTQKEKTIDPDLQDLNDSWPYLTPWQKSMIIYRFRFELAKQRAKQLYKVIAVKWIEIALRL